MVNMGEIFAHERIGDIEMERVQLSEKEIANFGLKKGDLLFARQSLVLSGAGKCSFVNVVDEVTTFESHLIRVRLDEGRVNPEFIFYYFLSPGGKANVQSLVMQVAAAGIRGSELAKLQLPVPSRPEQNRIAGILSAYDELIANNQRRIAVLEQMARALYREWFVYFRAPGVRIQPGSELPEGWEVKALPEVAEVTYGSPFDSKQFNTAGEGTPLIRIRDIPNGVSVTWTTQEASEKYHVSDGEILVGMDGDFHMCLWSSGHAYQNQRVAKFTSRGAIGNYHLFLALEKPIQELNRAIVGTTVAHLGAMHIKEIKVILPTKDVLERAKAILEPIAGEQLILKKQTANLRRTRDLLLPRLMSGRVEMGVERPKAKVIVMAPPPAPQEGKPTEEFVEAVLIGQLTRALANPEYPLGRFRLTKMAYFCHRFAEEDVAKHYLKKAAGPYAPWSKYAGPEKIAERNGYVCPQKNGQYEGLVSGEHIEKIDRYVANYPVCSMVDTVVSKFRYYKNDQLELIATVDFAALDLVKEAKEITVVHIRQVIKDHPDWAPKLDRKEFSEEYVAGALKELKDLFPSTYTS